MVELKPISDELTTDGELCEAMAAWDNCAMEDPPRFKFWSEPMPNGDPVLLGVPYTEKGLFEEELINCLSDSGDKFGS